MQSARADFSCISVAQIAKRITEINDLVWYVSNIDQGCLLWAKQKSFRKNYRITESIFLEIEQIV